MMALNLEAMTVFGSLGFVCIHDIMGDLILVKREVLMR